MFRWRLVAAIIVCALLPACTKWSGYGRGFRGATGGERLERAFWDAVRNKQWRALDQHLGATYIAVTPEGVLDHAATVEHLHNLEVSDYSIADLRTEPNGADVVVTYVFTAHGQFRGQPLPETPVRMMTVWQQVSRGWIAIAHSEAPVQQRATAGAMQ